jgi:hypothetical protein
MLTLEAKYSSPRGKGNLRSSVESITSISSRNSPRSIVNTSIESLDPDLSDEDNDLEHEYYGSHFV